MHIYLYLEIQNLSLPLSPATLLTFPLRYFSSLIIQHKQSRQKKLYQIFKMLPIQLQRFEMTLIQHWVEGSSADSNKLKVKRYRIRILFISLCKFQREIDTMHGSHSFVFSFIILSCVYLSTRNLQKKCRGFISVTNLANTTIS